MRGKQALGILFFALALFLFPSSSFAEKLLVVDPGHGGKYSGTCGATGQSTGICEETVNLLVGLKVKEILKNSGIRVVMTRETDREFSTVNASVDLVERMKVANSAAAGNNDNSLFVSIHHNASPTSPYTKGLETYYYDGVNHYQPDYPPDPMQMNYLSESKRWAETAHARLLSGLGSTNKGIGNDQSFYVIRHAQMPAILLELGYMTNRDEEARIKTAEFQWAAAQAIADAAINFFQVFEVHDDNGKIIKMFKTQQEAITFASQQAENMRVFDKNQQAYTYSNVRYEVYHRTNGLMKSFASEANAVSYASGWRNTRVVSLENNQTLWSNYLSKKYDVYVNNQVQASFIDYDGALAYSIARGNSKVVNNLTNDVLWTNIGGVAVTRDVALEKIAGANRFETAIQVSQTLYPDGFAEDKLEKTVILATGYQFADALSAGPLSNLYDQAPILLSRADQLDESVKQEIIRLGATKVVMIGGEAALSKNVESTLASMNVMVERIAGANRYETNRKIIEMLGDVNGLFVVYGGNFPDALAVSPIAANQNWGILLAQTNQVTPVASLDLTNKEIVMAGGTAALQDTVKQQLASSYPASKITRLAGADRYATNAVINLYFENSTASDSLLLTTGKDFPDALASAPLAIGTGTPLVLVGDGWSRTMETYLLEYGRDNVVQTLAIIGGSVNSTNVQSMANRVK